MVVEVLSSVLYLLDFPFVAMLINRRMSEFGEKIIKWKEVLSKETISPITNSKKSDENEKEVGVGLFVACRFG